jgi:hypothetical protein|tara:strand:- start:904 stop:1257 length:354 start_codon:yes stop_codon:yes gene_type:complete
MKEYQVQIKVVNYLKSKKLRKLRFFHVPNQGVRSIKYKSILVKMGLLAGCPDLILEFKNGKIVYLELKSKLGGLSIRQKLWKLTSKYLNTPYYVIKYDNFLSVQKQIDAILNKHYKI